MTTLQILDNEITGADVRAGHIVTVFDTVPGTDTQATLVVFVTDVTEIGNGILWLSGTAVMADTQDILAPIIVTVHAMEPVGVVGTMRTDDWSADYARRAARLSRNTRG